MARPYILAIFSMTLLQDRTHWIFDMDGTLTVAQHDFEAIRRELGLPEDSPILESLAQLPEAEAAPLHVQLDEIELRIAGQAQAQPGAIALLSTLQKQGKQIGILTRNTRPGADATLTASELVHFFEPAHVLSRHCCAPKPSPEGINHLLQLWDAPPEKAVMVGDYVFDLQAGRNAGTTTVHLDVTGEFAWPEQTDVQVSALEELLGLL